MNLFYLGDAFYLPSGTIMSSIYTTDGHRSDWGKVQMALDRGECVQIRPANKAEMQWAKTELRRIKKSRTPSPASSKAEAR